MRNNKPGNIIIVGASSGIGRRIAEHYACRGWRVGVCARRKEPLAELAARYPRRVSYCVLDVTDINCAEQFAIFVAEIGGMDVLVYAAGCGWNNPRLNSDKDELTVQTNVAGFTRIVDAAFDLFVDADANTIYPRGQIVAITSIAGTKGIGISASYSASKRYQWSYLESLEQLARVRNIPVDITDIRPGFIDTALLDTTAFRYPMLMSVDHAARRIIRAIDRRRHIAVIDGRWAVVTAIWRRIPRFIWRRLKIFNPPKEK